MLAQVITVEPKPKECLHRPGGNLPEMKSDIEDKIQFCPCPFCQYAQTHVKPEKLVRGQHDYTFEERLDREKLLAHVFTDPGNQDYFWVLSNLRQPLPGVTQLQFLVPETLFFKNGNTEVFIYTSTRTENMGSLCFETGPVIKMTNIRKLFAHAHSSLNLFPLDAKKNNLFKVAGNQITGGFKANKDQILQALTQEKIRSMMKTLGSEDVTFLKKFCEQAKIDWIQDFKVIVARKQRYIKDKTTEFPHEIVGYKPFIDLAQTPLVRKMWRELTFIQRFPKLLRGDITMNRIRFDVTDIEDPDLFRRASFPVLSSISSLSENNTDFTTPEAERQFMKRLLEENSYKFRLYTVYKIYQAIWNFTRLKLTLFFAEFSEDLFGGVYLTDLKLFKIENEEDLDVYQAWKTIQQRIIKSTSPITIGAELDRIDKEINVLNHQKQRNTEEVSKVSLTNAGHQTFVPLTEEQRVEKIDEVQQAMMQRFKRTVLKNMGEERMVVDEKFLRLKTSADEIFAKLQPKFKEKLSKIAFKPLAEYQKDQKSKLGNLTMNSNISGIKRPSIKGRPKTLDYNDHFFRPPKSSALANQVVLKVLKDHSEEIDSKVDRLLVSTRGKPYMKKSYRRLNLAKGGSTKNHKDKVDTSKLYVLKNLTDHISRSVDSRGPSKFDVKILRSNISRSVDRTNDNSAFDTDRNVAKIFPKRSTRTPSSSVDRYRILS